MTVDIIWHQGVFTFRYYGTIYHHEPEIKVLKTFRYSPKYKEVRMALRSGLIDHYTMRDK